MSVQHLFEDVFNVGVVSRKLHLGSGLRAPHHGNITKMRRSKKYSKSNPKLASAGRLSFQLRGAEQA
jgi:hypothetical protein